MSYWPEEVDPAIPTREPPEDLKAPMVLMASVYDVEVTEENEAAHFACRQIFRPEGGSRCVGYHCPYCGGACSQLGHLRGRGSETRLTCVSDG